MNACPICLVPKDIITFDTCTHGVCKECMLLLEKFEIQKCPICRADFGNVDIPEPDMVRRRRRRDLPRIEYLKRRVIIKARQKRSRSKKDGRESKLHGTNYY